MKWEDFQERSLCDSPIAKKQKVVTRELLQRNDKGGAQATEGNKYATVNIVFDRGLSIRRSIESKSKSTSDGTNTHTSPLLSLQSDLHLESVEVQPECQLREIPLTLPIRY